MKVADLVEEDGAAVGRLELADLELVGAGEGASLVTEQFALQQVPRHGGAVDLDEGPRPPRGEMVDRVGDELLAGAGLARDDDGDVDARRLAQDLACFQYPWTAPELHLTSDSRGNLVRRRRRRRRLGANQGVYDRLEVVEAQRLVEHGIYLEGGGVEAVVVAVGDRDDRAGIPTVKLQTPNEICRVSSVAAQVDQREGERALRERLHGFARGRDGDALVAADPQKAEESQLSCRIDFDHECSSLSHLGLGAGSRGKCRTRSFFGGRAC